MMLLPLFVVLLMATPVFAQSGPGLWQAAPGTQIANCINIGSPVTNRTWCFDGNNNPNYTIKVWDGTQYVSITGTGGGAPVDAFYVLTKANALLPNAVNLNLLPPAILVNDPVLNSIFPYGGASCPPGFAVTAINATGAVTCVPPTGLSALGGKVQMCNTTTSAVITFSSPVADANYPVTLGTQPDTGTPPHVVADYNTPTVNGFNLTISDQPGTGNCVQVSWAAGTASTGGGGGTPGGSNMQVQFNDSGVFGGASELLWDKALNILRPNSSTTTSIGTRAKTFLSIYADGDHATFTPGLALLGQNSGTSLTDVIANFGSEGQITQLTSTMAVAHAYMALNTNTNIVYYIAQDGTYSSPSNLGTGAHLGQLRFVGFNTGYVTYADIIGRVSSDDTAKGRLILQVSGLGWNFYGQGTMRLHSLAFANLPTTGDAGSDGNMAYCSNCDPSASLATCTTGGASTGAFAYRVNGAWKCIG